MSHREDGEFELILGNKQLLSVLGVVIILLGVFFAMGFLAGRSTGPAVAAKTKASEPPALIESATKPSASEAIPEPVPAVPAAVAEAGKEASKPPEPKAELAKEAPKPPEPKREAAAPKPAPPAPAAADGYYETAPKGTYLQVAATRRADALNTRSLLMKAGMPAILTPSAKPELVRVLVGPIPDAETVARYREELKKVGIGSPIVAKY